MVTRNRLVHELVSQYKAYRIKCTSLTQYVLQSEVSAAGHVTLREAARPRVTASVPQQAVIAETWRVVFTELAHQGDILKIETVAYLQASYNLFHSLLSLLFLSF